jgi:hypothetical protein
VILIMWYQITGFITASISDWLFSGLFLFEEFLDQISLLDFWVAHSEIDLLIVLLGSLESKVRSMRRWPQVPIDPIPLIERDQRLHIPFRSNPARVHTVARSDRYQVDRIRIECVFQIRSRHWASSLKQKKHDTTW